MRIRPAGPDDQKTGSTRRSSGKSGEALVDHECRPQDALDHREQVPPKRVDLLPEEQQIHPGTGEFLGNFPPAFSHVGVLASGLRLLKAERASATATATDA